MGYYNEGPSIGDVLRILIFFIGLAFVLGGLFGGMGVPSDLELIPKFLYSTFWRIVMIVVGFLLLILAINPEGISGRVGISVSR